MAFSIKNEKKFKNQQAGGCLFGTQEYCKAMELKWRYLDRYNDWVKMLESFI